VITAFGIPLNVFVAGERDGERHESGVTEVTTKKGMPKIVIMSAFRFGLRQP